MTEAGVRERNGGPPGPGGTGGPEAGREPPRAPSGSPGGALIGVLPGLVVIGVAAVCLHLGHVSARDIAAFGVYVGFGLALPGTLVWRALGPTLRWRVEEVAIGTAVGYALETAMRVLGSLVRAPHWVAAGWPVAVIAGFVLIPRLRRHWRSAAAPVPRGVGWAYATISALLLGWLVYSYFQAQPVVWSDDHQPLNDLVFMLALAGEAATRWPPQFPYVLGEPLQYHWFYGAHLAAAHTATGIDLPTLLFRCALVPMLPVLVVGTGALATRLAGRAWAGPLGAFLGWIVTDLTLQQLDETVRYSPSSPVGSLMGALIWYSPTQTFSAVILAPAAVLAVDVVRGQGRRGHWVLLPVLFAVCAGAKGSALPVLVVAVATVVFIGLLVGRIGDRSLRWRLHLPTLVLLLLAGTVYELFSQFMYRGATYGLTFRPFGMASVTLLGASFTGHWYVDPGPSRSAFITALGVVCFTTPWAGFVLLVRRGTRTDPAFWLLCGAGVVGLATMALMYHSGQSQLYFIRTALPLLAAGAAWALTGSLADTIAVVFRSARRTAVIAVGAIAVGTVVCGMIAWRWGVSLVPRPVDLQVRAVAGPYLATAVALVVLAVAGTAAVWLLRRSRPDPDRGRGWPLVVAVAVFALLWAGAGATRMISQFAWVGVLASRDKPLVGTTEAGPELRGAVWLRDHSDPTDVFATNVQCTNRVQPAPGVPCSSIAVWVTAYSERRSLVNSWGYTAANAMMAERIHYSGYPTNLPFWDPARLARSQSMIAAPTIEQAQALAADYGVRWFYVDTRYGGASPRLDQVLAPRFHEGTVTVYEVPR
jgi:hypothetical protein